MESQWPQCFIILQSPGPSGLVRLLKCFIFCSDLLYVGSHGCSFPGIHILHICHPLCFLDGFATCTTAAHGCDQQSPSPQWPQIALSVESGVQHTNCLFLCIPWPEDCMRVWLKIKVHYDIGDLGDPWCLYLCFLDCLVQWFSTCGSWSPLGVAYQRSYVSDICVTIHNSSKDYSYDIAMK